MERRFHCTVCGKCCNGWLPLSLTDALANADRFPLAMVLSTVRQGAKAFDLTARMGVTIPFGKRKRVAVQITPTSYLPAALSCPALASDGRCSIHESKPSRCKTMPFSPFREEADQAALLIPRDGWLCDTSNQAPVVYRKKKVVERLDFDCERRQLNEQASVLKAYAENLIAAAPNVAAGLESAAKKPRGGHVVLNFSTLLPRLPQTDKAGFARQQIPIFSELAKRTEGKSGMSDYHRYYRENITGLTKFLEHL